MSGASKMSRIPSNDQAALRYEPRAAAWFRSINTYYVPTIYKTEKLKKADNLLIKVYHYLGFNRLFTIKNLTIFSFQFLIDKIY